MNQPYALSPRSVDALLKVVPMGESVLEVGTGCGTKLLAEFYDVISIEHDVKWHTGHSELIQVPLVPISGLDLPQAFYKRFPNTSTVWYDVDTLQDKLAGKEYSAIIIDGPAGGSSRGPMWWFYDKLFDTNVPVIVDDVHRKYEWKVAMNIGALKGVARFEVLYAGSGEKMFALIV